MKRYLFLILFTIMSISTVYADSPVCIDMQKVKQIESSGNPRAINRKTGARGLYQITPIVLKEWNNFHKDEQYTIDDLLGTKANTIIAHWYMNARIPQMLKYYHIPDSVEMRLRCYNSGIGTVLKGVYPQETKDYVNKYYQK